jgi:hypothetical protein
VKILVEGFEHRLGEHCASTAIRNILNFHGLPLSEAMVFGLGGGLGFFHIRNDALSPTRIFHGRTLSLETDFCTNAELPVVGGSLEDDDRAWLSLKAQLDAGVPVMLSTDTYYLGYQNTTSHFPGHRAVAVGYDESDGRIFIADRKLREYQSVSREELRRSRNADDYPVSCQNEYQHFLPGSSGSPSRATPAGCWSPERSRCHRRRADSPPCGGWRQIFPIGKRSTIGHGPLVLATRSS